MPFCFWCGLCRKKKSSPEDFEPMNEDLTEINENVTKSSPHEIFNFYMKQLNRLISQELMKVNQDRQMNLVEEVDAK